MTVEAQRRGQVSGPSPDLVLLSLPRGEGFVDPWRAQESDQRGAKLLPEKGGEMAVRVNLLGQGRDQSVQALQQEHDRVPVPSVAGTRFSKVTCTLFFFFFLRKDSSLTSSLLDSYF